MRKFILPTALFVTLYFAFTAGLLLPWVVFIQAILIFLLLFSVSQDASIVKKVAHNVDGIGIVLRYLNVDVKVVVSDLSKVSINQFNGWVDVMYKDKEVSIPSGQVNKLNTNLWVKIPKGYEILLDVGPDLGMSTLVSSTIRNEYDNNRVIVVCFVSFTNFVLKENAKVLRFRILPTMLNVTLDEDHKVSATNA